MLEIPLVQGFIAFFIAVTYATFAEYVMHRLMHAGLVLQHQHQVHHEEGTGNGWSEEFLNYYLPALSVIWVGFLYSNAAGIGFAIGGTFAAAWAAYAHQLQHEKPELVFWLPRPIHYLHHKYNMQRRNFGISVDIWDRVFGTYSPCKWQPQTVSIGEVLKNFFKIQWRKN